MGPYDFFQRHSRRLAVFIQSKERGSRGWLMSFRDHMKVPVAKAEIQVVLEFSRRMMTYGFRTQIGFTFSEKEIERFHVYGTVVDGIWPEAKVIFFLDGQPHLKSRAMIRDEAITTCLQARGFKVLRFPYKAPISNRRLLQIVNEVEAVLKKRGYFQRLSVDDVRVFPC